MMGSECARLGGVRVATTVPDRLTTLNRRGLGPGWIVVGDDDQVRLVGPAERGCTRLRSNHVWDPVLVSTIWAAPPCAHSSARVAPGEHQTRNLSPSSGRDGAVTGRSTVHCVPREAGHVRERVVVNGHYSHARRCLQGPRPGSVPEHSWYSAAATRRTSASMRRRHQGEAVRAVARGVSEQDAGAVRRPGGGAAGSRGCQAASGPRLVARSRMPMRVGYVTLLSPSTHEQVTAVRRRDNRAGTATTRTRRSPGSARVT